MRCGHCKRNDTAVDVGHVRACGLIRAGAAWTPEIDRAIKSTPVLTPVTEDGIYHYGNGVYVKVVWNQDHTRLWAKVWNVESETWVYAPGLIRSIHAEDRVTAEQAKVFGALYGRCIFCSKDLTDERSIFAGYGEKCASNNGLPWGEVT